jgi:hypothetical protein
MKRGEDIGERHNPCVHIEIDSGFTKLIAVAAELFMMKGRPLCYGQRGHCRP